jgi:Mg2+ and Co2+ transporter CorA
MFDLQKKMFDFHKKITSSDISVSFVGQAEVVLMTRNSKKKIIVPYNQRLCRMIQVNKKKNLWDLVMDITKGVDDIITVDVYSGEIEKKYLSLREALKK